MKQEGMFFKGNRLESQGRERSGGLHVDCEGWPITLNRLQVGALVRLIRVQIAAYTEAELGEMIMEAPFTGEDLDALEPLLEVLLEAADAS